MTDEERQDQQDENDTPLAGQAETEQERQERESGGNAAEVVESKDGDGPAKTPGA